MEKRGNPNILNVGFRANPNNMGRPRGSKDVLGRVFTAELLADFEANGKQAIVDCREKSPSDYLKIIASILPKHVEVKHDVATKESIESTLNAIDRIIADANSLPSGFIEAVATVIEPRETEGIQAIH
jgi:hypothetical protein